MSGSKKTQLDKVLEILKLNLGCWVSAGKFLSHRSPDYPKAITTYSQRCGDLDRDFGYDIRSRKEKGKPTFEYKLLFAHPTKPGLKNPAPTPRGQQGLPLQ